MSSPDDERSSSTLELLKRVMFQAERGEDIPVEDLPALAGSLRRILANDKALRIAVSDETVRPGERTPLDRAKRKISNQALRECAAAFYRTRTAYDFRHQPYQADCPVRMQAHMLSRDLSEYFTTAWLIERSSESCPERHLGKARFYFWTALRARERALGAKQIETILTETN
jgi:hypothetical protein